MDKYLLCLGSYCASGRQKIICHRELTSTKKKQGNGPSNGWALSVGTILVRCLEKVPLEQ